MRRDLPPSGATGRGETQETRTVPSRSVPPTRDDGFTLVELLVVIVVIAVLAGIAVPLFVGQREKAYDAAAKSDLRNLASAITAELLQAGHGNDGWVASMAIWMDEMPDGENRYAMYGLQPADGREVLLVDLGRASPGVVLAGGEAIWVLDAEYDDEDLGRDDVVLADWCIAVSHAEGRYADWMYSPKGGYAKGDGSQTVSTTCA